MALPEFGLLTMSMLATEYAIVAPYMLTKLYGMPGIPAAGKILLSDFYNKANTFTLTLSTSTASPDIHQLARNAGWSGTAPLIVNISAPYINSLRLDGSKTFPGGLAINIMSGCFLGGVFNGGAALYTRVPVSISNAGTMAGGGGKGGRGRSYFADQAGVTPSSTTRCYGGGGDGGNGQGFASNAVLTIQAATNGAAGGYSLYTGEVIGGTACWAQGCSGGAGLAWGQQGGTGGTTGGGYGGWYSSAGIDYDEEFGGLAGAFVDGNSFVTWGSLGTRLGRAIN